MKYLADKSYLAFKAQADPDTPEIPDLFAALISESIRLNPNIVADRRMKGIDWKSDDVLKGSRSIEGDIQVFCDPDVLGHLLNMTYAKGLTTGNVSDGYTHPFTVGDGRSYTIEISRGDFAQRIWGVKGENLKVEFQDNKMLGTLTIKALGQFFASSLAVALTGPGMTSLVLSTDYDLRPTDGLLAGDKVRVGGVDITITSVDADGKTLHFGATTVTASIGDLVALLAQTPSFGTQREPFYMGNTLVGVGVDETAATAAAGTKATATPCYNFSFDFKNNMLDAPASGSTGPSVLLNQVKEASIEISRLFENPTQHQKWIEMVKQAITMISTGRFIKTNLTTWEKLTIKFFKVKTLTNENALDVGQYIFDKQKFEVLYDAGEDAAVEIELVNRTPADDYEESS
jgi:hypothetical protein